MVLAYSDRIPRVPPYSGYSLLLNNFTYGAFTSFGCAFQHSSVIVLNGLWSPSPQKYYYFWFGLFRFRSPLLSESLFYFLFLRVIRWFSSPGSPRMTIDSSYDNTTLLVLSFLIRTSAGQTFICNSPQLFAACHVLLRRHVPRHPPYALCSLFFRLHFRNPSNLFLVTFTFRKF